VGVCRLFTSLRASRRQPFKAPPQAQTPPRSPPGSSVDAQGRTPYVQWVTLLRQVAALLEEVNRLGGVDAIIARLTPRQVDGVLA
jgi:hypothetical protein